MTEKEIIQGCLAKNGKAQYALYQLYAPQLLSIALRYTRTTQEAEDVLQESFIKAFEKFNQFKGDSKVFFWLKRIVVNNALNIKRNKLYMYPMINMEDLQEGDLGASVLDDVEVADLLKMIQSLPDGCRTIFNLYGIEGYKHREIATMLQITEGTSRSQYARAKKLLQDKILKSMPRHIKEN